MRRGGRYIKRDGQRVRVEPDAAAVVDRPLDTPALRAGTRDEESGGAGAGARDEVSGETGNDKPAGEAKVNRPAGEAKSKRSSR